MVSAIVLAAGLSSRMGADNKLLMPYKNKPAVRVVTEHLLAAGLKDIIIVTGHELPLIRQALEDLPILFTHNPHYETGMTSSIQAGVSLANGDGYMICLGDMVTITAEEYRSLSGAFSARRAVDAQCICLPRYKEKPGNPVIFSSFYKQPLLQNTQPEGCKNIVQSNRQHIHYIDMDMPHVLQDFDFPDDYKALLRNQ